ncbi:MAG: hypothetical protein PHN18_01355 [Sulfurospirillaceae bacterium]|nr:hypothetical protein [Sulfurospirillaceae bacterium]MDD2826013.1 hypothetical protein [Sulfurospirillaceae bacterium]
MNTIIESFLSKVNALYQLEPKNLPMDVVREMVKMSPEELFKTCSQLAVLRHNIPKEQKPVSLNEKEMAVMAEEYLRELLKRFR